MITATQIDTPALKANYNLGYVWVISIVAAMGGLLFGWDWVVIGGAKAFFEPFFGITKDVIIAGNATLITDENLSG